ncbi:MAG: rhodanese-like domain-containing protein [Acetobacteraceae bacterium]
MTLTRRGLFAGIALVATAPAEPAGYRQGDYRAPTPRTLNGIPALSTQEAAHLWKAGTGIFIDTLPRPPRPPGLPPATIWQPKPRYDIPGSIWLADTGYGELPAIMAVWFASALHHASNHQRDRILVFYCLANCWMSWNAAKRAEALGYTNVQWYSDGTDGWTEAGLPVELREPLPRPAE